MGEEREKKIRKATNNMDSEDFKSDVNKKSI